MCSGHDINCPNPKSSTSSNYLRNLAGPDALSAFFLQYRISANGRGISFMSERCESNYSAIHLSKEHTLVCLAKVIKDVIVIALPH